MRKRTIIGVSLAAGLAAAALFAQQRDITSTIIGPCDKPALAVIDFHGTGAADPLMKAFNTTLMADLQASALFDLKSKSFFPTSYPQQPSDLVPEDGGKGRALQDWSGAPVNASHLVFGYAAAVNGAFALYGNVYDTRQASIQSAKLFEQRYAGNLDEAGVIRVAHQFANDIIQKFGGSASLLDSRIYFTSSRGAANGGREIWVMDWDGKNQKQLTSFKGLVAHPSVSADGSKLAFTQWPTGNPSPVIAMINTESGRRIPFYNQAASLNAAAAFTPDGSKVFYSSSASGKPQIYVANIDGGDFTRITGTDGNPTEPKVNPKNPNSLLFVQGFPNVQVYRMNAEGAGIERVTNGEGEASNPSWSPDGQHIAFAWTRGYQAGAFNIFVMDTGTQQLTQLTHNEGKNENPVWAPDGKHIVFMRTPSRGGSSQIFSMLANGTQVTQLTTQGMNKYPVWGVK